MSENYRYYAAKMAQRRARQVNPALRDQLTELLAVVMRCEAMWALEERISRDRRRA